MGRYISGATAAVSAARRTRRLVLTASDPAIAVPEWAQGGNGIVYVTGTGAGGSGGVRAGSDGATSTGQGGNAGARAERFPIMIDPGVLTISVMIGAGGVRRFSTGNSEGHQGGYSEVVVGARSLRLEGGFPGIGAPGEFFRPALPLVDGQSVIGIDPKMHSLQLMRNGGAGFPYSDEYIGMGLFFGARGAHGADKPYGTGAFSPFGRAGGGHNNITGVTYGEDATGYGAGGGGGGGSPGVGTTVLSGAGAPGLIILDIEEIKNA